jgi:hypothetical protein
MNTGLLTLVLIAAALVALGWFALKRSKRRNQEAIHAREAALFDDTGNAMSAMVARAFPEGAAQEQTDMLRRLGFRFGKTSGFVPNARPEDVQRVVESLFSPADTPKVHSLLGRYGTGEEETGRVHLAVLRLSGGDLSKLEAELKRAKSDRREVCNDAETIHAFVGSERPLAPGVKDRSDQVFREYVLWLSQHIKGRASQVIG